MADEQKRTFSWASVVAESGMHGMAALLAAHTRPVSYDPDRQLLSLQIELTLKHLADGLTLDGFKRYLSKVFGDGLRVDIAFVDGVDSATAKNVEKITQKMGVALREISQDALGAEIMQVFGGKIVKESIRLAQSD